MTARDPALSSFALPASRAHYYGGAWHASVSGATTEVHDPATGAALGPVAEGGPDDADRAVQAAHAAFAGWRDTPAQTRARCIRNASAILLDHRDELAWLDAVDT